MAPRASLWATLGIAATNDPAQIRRAYAARLKVVQPEDDPEGFKQLRAAYEQAMRLAERSLAVAVQAAARVAAQPLQPDPELGPEPPVELAPDVAELAVASPAASPVVEAPAARAPRPAAKASVPLVGRPADHAAHEAACNRLAALLTGPADPQRGELDAALTAVLSSAALDDVSIHLQTETWLARLICNAAPRSDAIVEPAAAAFGWKPDALYVGDAAVAGAIARLAALEHNRLFARLDGLLRGAAEPGENARFAALDAITAPGVIRHPQHGPQLEVALARLLVETRPRSDDLIPVATRRLGWDAPARQASADPAVLEAAGIAAQLRPRPKAVVRRRTNVGGFLAGARIIWLVIWVVGLLGYCTSQLSKIGAYEQQADLAAPSAAAPSTAPQVSFTQYPARRIDVVVGSSVSGLADLSCVAGDGRLRDCSVITATDAGLASQGRYFALQITWPFDYAAAPPVGARVPVRVTFRGV